MEKIYGIGFERAVNINVILGLSLYFAVSYLNYYVFESFSYIAKIFFLTDERLQTVIRQQMAFLFAIKARRGIRFSKGLPTRGQATHSNGKQNKYLKRNAI
jgi:ribosomal protein S13